MDAGSLLERLGRPSWDDLDEDSDIIEWVAAFVGEEVCSAMLYSYTQRKLQEFSESIATFVENNCACFCDFDPGRGDEHRLEYTVGAPISHVSDTFTHTHTS